MVFLDTDEYYLVPMENNNNKVNNGDDQEDEMDQNMLVLKFRSSRGKLTASRSYGVRMQFSERGCMAIFEIWAFFYSSYSSNRRGSRRIPWIRGST
jgi:hypothetical protein